MRTILLVCVTVASIGCNRAGARYAEANRVHASASALLEQLETERQAVVDEYENIRTTARQMIDEARYEATQTRSQVLPVLHAGELNAKPIATSITYHPFADMEKIAGAKLEQMEIVYAERMKQWNMRLAIQRERVQLAKAEKEAAKRGLTAVP